MIALVIQKNKDHIPSYFAYKLVRVDDKYSKDVVLYRGKIAVYKFIQSIFNKYSYCRSVMKKYFNKDLIMLKKKNNVKDLIFVGFVIN